MNDEIKEILNDNDELLVRYKDNSFESFDTLPINVLNYITNLQQENERLKENNQNMQEEMARTWEKCEDYKSRCEKAIEYINNGEILDTWGNYRPFKDFGYGKDLLNILQNGSDDNDKD